jgi:hypothetical protein
LRSAAFDRCTGAVARRRVTLLGDHHPGVSTLGIVWTAATCIVMRILARARSGAVVTSVGSGTAGGVTTDRTG